ncbi:MAG TPA: glycosyltransferase, partial [Devosia sp.]|nr:glycosyltransferase [Devosia sp.]
WGDIAEFQGISAFQGDETVRIEPLQFKTAGRGDIGGYWAAIRDPGADALIIIGNPNYRSTWIMALAGRAMGKKILFWAHGWLRPEPPLKRLLRNTYYGLADKVLVYGERAIEMAERSGFRRDKVAVIYNSLDWDQTKLHADAAAAQDRNALRAGFGMPLDKPVLICTARLTLLCQFDLLLNAAAQLRQAGQAYHIALVGDGPERVPLEQLASDLCLDIRFHGAVYDEAKLARMFAASDLTVSPGKVGLTAIHSLSYGVPVITHGDLDAQMPEVEAIEPGITGDFFERNNVDSLAAAIEDWFVVGRDPASVRAACHKVIEAKFNPLTQTRLIDKAVSDVLHDHS